MPLDNVDKAVHVITQLIYRVLCLFGTPASRARNGALKRSDQLYWTARCLEADGEAHMAFDAARAAFAALKDAKPKETFPVMGAPVGVLLDELATRLGRREDAQTQLSELLEVFEQIQSERHTPSSTIERLIKWLQHRLEPRA